MKVYIDGPSFRIPLERSLEAAKREFIDAGRVVSGANARAAAAHRALEDIVRFRRTFIDKIRDGSLVRLPRMRDAWWRPIGHFHLLEVGEWHGVFLIMPDGSDAAALIFSRAPHNYMGRLDEVLRRHQMRLKRSRGASKQSSGPEDARDDEGDAE